MSLCHCSWCVLKEAKSLFADKIRNYITSPKFGARDYWQLCKSILNKNKSSIPPLFHQFEVFSSTANKVENFVGKFSSNSILDSSGVSLSDFPSQTEYLLSDKHITQAIICYHFWARVCLQIQQYSCICPEEMCSWTCSCSFQTSQQKPHCFPLSSLLEVLLCSSYL